MPEINGTMDTTCLTDTDEEACDYGNSNSVPASSVFNALVTIPSGGSYVTVQDLRIADSAGIGLIPNGSNDHIIVRNNNIGPNAHIGIDVKPGSSQIHIVDNTVQWSATCSYKLRGRTTPGLPSTCTGSFGSGIEMGGTNGEDVYNIAENNDVYGSYGEGLSVNGANYVWFIGNRVRGIRNDSLFVDNGNHTLFDSNVVFDFDTTAVMGAIVGTNSFNVTQEYDNTSLSFTIEPRVFCSPNGVCPSDFNIGRNNIVAGSTISSRTVKASNRTGAGPPATNPPNDTEPLGVYLYGNTFLGNVDLDNGVDTTPQKGALEFINNIVQDTSTSTICGAFSSTGYSPYQFEDQLWRVNPSDSHCDGTGDEYGKANLARDVDTFGESNWTMSSGPTISDVVLANGATGDDSGTDLNGTTVTWLTSFASSLDYFGDVDYPYAPNATNFAYKLYYDFDGTARSNTPNKGADETN